MRIVIRFSALAAILVALPLQAQTRNLKDTAFASLVTAERAFSMQSIKKGTQNAFVTWMAPGAFLYRPKVVNAHAFLKARPMPATVQLVWDPTYADIARSGDLGFTTGPWLSQRRDQPLADPTFGEYVRVWRRQANGAWKAEIDAGIAHGADAIGPKEVATAPASLYRGATVAAATARKSLLDADVAFNDLSSKQGAPAAFMKLRTTDMRLMRNGEMPMIGDSAIAALRRKPQYLWKPVGAGVARSADLGYTYGVYGMPGETGDYLRVWRRDAAGVWEVVIDLTSPGA